MYIEVRLHDQIRRFSPVDVEEGSGRTSYEQLPGVKIKVKTHPRPLHRGQKAKGITRAQIAQGLTAYHHHLSRFTVTKEA